MRHRANSLSPPPPPPEVAQSAAYRALSASAKALLMLLDIELSEQGGMIAAMDCDAACEAAAMPRPAFDAALAELSQAGFVIVAESGGFCIVALSSAWRRA